jgi:hypothetical protein
MRGGRGRFIGAVAALFLAASPCVAEVRLSAAPADATATINTAIAAGQGEVVLACRTWNISGSLSLSSGNPSIRGESPGCAVVQMTSSGFAAFNCSGNPNQVAVRDLTIIGSAGTFNGAWTSISDAGQSAVHVSNCPLVTVDNIVVDKVSGTAIDCEQANSGFGTVSAMRFGRITVSNSYRALWARNDCEYSIWSDLIVRNNVFGMIVSAGNVLVDRFQFVANYNNLQVSAGVCHGTFSNGMSNHGYGYNADILDCLYGHSFSNVRFLGDGSGSLTTGGIVRIANSRGINFSGGQMGSNLIVQAANPWGISTSAGPNKLNGAWIRNDIPGWVNPNNGAVPTPGLIYAGGLCIQDNTDAVSGGAWSLNNC